MKNFSFMIDKFGIGCMIWRMQLGENKFELNPTNLFSDDIQHLLWAVLGFHPDYDEAIWCMAGDRQEEHVPCEKIEVDEEGSTAVWSISINEEKSTKQERILHMHIFHDLNISQHTYEADVPYYEFAEEIMKVVDVFIRSLGLTNYYKEWGRPFPLTDYVNAKAILMRKKPECLEDEILLLERPFYIAFMDEPIRKITIESDNVCYGPMPEIDEITHQRLTISAKGRVDITTRTYVGTVVEKKHFYVDKFDSKELVQDLVDYFQERPLITYATDVGSWDLTIESESGKKYVFNGALIADEDDFFSEYSIKVRKYLKRRDLFVFDGQDQTGLIFLSCEFEGGSKSYYYRTDDETIDIGDYVRVPVGENGRTAIVEVVDIDYFEEDEVPMPLEKVKVVIEKVDEFGVYPEDEEDE